MKTSFSLKDKLKVVKELKKDSFFRLMQYEELDGTSIKEVNQTVTSIKRKLKQVRVVLNDSVVKVKEEKLLYSKGDIEEIEYEPIPRFGRRLFKEINDEYDDIYPSYTGTGEIILTLSFSDFIFIDLEDEEITIKEEYFWVCEGEIAVDYGEDDEIILNGSGVVVMELPVSEEEVMRCALNKDVLQSYDDEAILQRGKIDKRENKKGIAYVGSGEVWLAPTKRIYDDIRYNLKLQE
ncbi:MAG: hypothetical protein ACRDCW_10850 [Sarcina sp.]